MSVSGVSSLPAYGAAPQTNVKPQQPAAAGAPKAAPAAAPAQDSDGDRDGSGGINVKA